MAMLSVGTSGDFKDLNVANRASISALVDLVLLAEGFPEPFEILDLLGQCFLFLFAVHHSAASDVSLQVAHHTAGIRRDLIHILLVVHGQAHIVQRT